jgi:hypothetical protein
VNKIRFLSRLRHVFRTRVLSNYNLWKEPWMSKYGLSLGKNTLDFLHK